MAQHTLKLTTQLLTLTALLLVSCAFPVKAQFSLYQDYKARRIGDVVTIVLQENITGKSSTDSQVKNGSAASADGAITGNLTPFLPLFGANSKINYQSDDKNAARQSQLLTGTISARVEDILPNGDLYIIGSRSNEINGEHHSVEIKGFLRPNDINNYNQVSSFRIANAEITYMKNDTLAHQVKKPGFWRNMMLITLGASLATAAFLGIY